MTHGEYSTSSEIGPCFVEELESAEMRIPFGKLTDTFLNVCFISHCTQNTPLG